MIMTVRTNKTWGESSVKMKQSTKRLMLMLSSLSHELVFTMFTPRPVFIDTSEVVNATCDFENTFESPVHKL